METGNDPLPVDDGVHRGDRVGHVSARGLRARPVSGYRNRTFLLVGAYLLIVLFGYIGLRQSELQRDRLHEAICQVAEVSSNALFKLARPPLTVEEQQRRQTVLDQYEADLEAGTHCDIQLRRVPPPPGG